MSHVWANIPWQWRSHKGSSRLLESTGEAEFHNRALPPWRMTEFFLHRSSEISTILNFTFQTYSKTIRVFTIFEFIRPRDGVFFAYVYRNINIWNVQFNSIQKRLGFSVFLNFSVRVTEFFLHMSSEISAIMKFPIQKYSKTIRVFIIFQ